jgi:hypothetical protein
MTLIKSIDSAAVMLTVLYMLALGYDILRWRTSPDLTFVSMPFRPHHALTTAPFILFAIVYAYITVGFAQAFITTLILGGSLCLALLFTQAWDAQNPGNKPTSASQLSDVAKDVLYKHFTKKPDDH